MASDNLQSWKDKSLTALIGLLAAILGVFATNTFTEFQSEKKTIASHATRLAEHEKDIAHVQEHIQDIKASSQKILEKIDSLLQRSK